MGEIGMVCPFCGKVHFVTVDYEEYMAWENGECIQKAMPTLSPTEREQLISHICPDCQNSVFGDDEDEEDASICMAESLAFTGQWW